jgi:Uncharacterized conserved protein
VVEVKTYLVQIERDGRGWMASVPSVPGCHTQGRTINQALSRTREALSLWVKDAERAKLVPDVRLPPEIKKQVERAVILRAQAERMNADATVAVLRAVAKMEVVGLSRRDTGELLGISRQRAHQIAEESHGVIKITTTKPTRAARRTR